MSTSPLYDIFDEDGTAQLRARLARRRPQLADLMPEEEQTSMLRRLANVGSSGLGAVGWLFDTPGAMLRGALSGGPMKGISALWESSEDRVDGRELLRQYGMVGDEDTWGNFTAGLAGEILLDPLTYANPFALLGRGALTTTGKALQRSGILEDAALFAKQNNKGIRSYLRSETGEGILDAYARGDAGRRASAQQRFEDAAQALGADPADLLRQRAAGSMEFRLPFMQTGVDVSLTGGQLGDLVASGLDAIGEGMKYTPGIGQVVNRSRAFFDTSVLGAVDPDAQWRNRQAFSNVRAAQRDLYEDYSKLAGDAIRAAPQNLPPELSSFNQRIQAAIGDLVEAGGDASKLIDQEAARAVAQTPAWQTLVDEGILRTQIAFGNAQQLGLKLPKWAGDQGTKFFPSQSVWFDVDAPPKLSPRNAPRRPRGYTSGERALNLDDNLSRGRNVAYDLPMRRQAFRQLMGGSNARQFQDTLLAATDDQLPGLLDAEWKRLNQATGDKMGRLYGGLEDSLARAQKRLASVNKQLLTPPTAPTAKRQLQRLQKALTDKVDKLQAEIPRRKKELGQLLRKADTQFAEKGLGLFDGSPIQDMLRYELGRVKVEENAKVVTDTLLKAASGVGGPGSFRGGGYISLAEAGKNLGLDPSRFNASMRRAGIDPTTAAAPSDVAESLKQLLPSVQTPTDSPFSKLYRSFTNAFKIGALANPAYHARNLYSGQIATLTQGITDPLSLAANAFAGGRLGGGDAALLLSRIRNIPQYQRVAQAVRSVNPAATADEVDAAILRQFDADFARNRLGQGAQTGDIDGAVSASTPALSATRPAESWSDYLSDLTSRSATDWATVRGVDWAGVLGDRRAPQVTRNPLLDLHERTGRRVEDANRIGAFVSALEKGYSPDAAADIVYRSQIDYSPEAFTAGEQALKRLVPFYSYPRGIAPLVAENMLYRPGGLQQQTIRAINRGGQGNEDYFVPEHLRQAAAVPLPGAEPGENLQRFLTNIDLPYTGLINLFSPGVGATPGQVAMDTVRRTGMNLAGNLNPAIKYVLENLFNRQLYTGRDLSDLYSVLEEDIGPWGQPIEQAVVNLVPGGTKLTGIYRTLRDERLEPMDKLTKLAFNNLTGLKVTDIDQERTKRMAARDALNQLLESTAGAKTYENITLPEDALQNLPRDQQSLYLLYRILQSDAAKRARERTKEQMTPLQMLGVG